MEVETDNKKWKIINNCISEFVIEFPKYKKIQDYYEGETDAMEEYKMITDRSNNKTSCNFMKKFIKREVSYATGNKLTYVSKSNDKNVVKDIQHSMAHWSEKHESELSKALLKFSKAYELYYTNSNGFNSKIITPLNGYPYINENDEIELFLHFFEKKFDTQTYMDIYYADRIEHYKKGDDKPIKEPTKHYFGEVPVGICELSPEGWKDTIFNDIKGLQDSYETNLSDISNEISDFRNAYLKVVAADLDEDKLIKMKELGIIKIPTKDAAVDWLIKNINDSFIQNTLKTIEDKMYQITSHINANEKLASNTSSLALRTRLVDLEGKCKFNIDALIDCVKTRLKFLFIYLNIQQGKNYDYRDIKVKYTPFIPQDDLMTAQIISQVGDKLSDKTALAELSFVDDPETEIEQRDRERTEMVDLDKLEVDEDE